MIKAASKTSEFRFFYETDQPIVEKIKSIATKIYGASSVDFSPKATRQIKRFTVQDFVNLPICMAKTHLSLSHDPKLKGRPEGFELLVRYKTLRRRWIYLSSDRRSEDNAGSSHSSRWKRNWYRWRRQYCGTFLSNSFMEFWGCHRSYYEGLMHCIIRECRNSFGMLKDRFDSSGQYKVSQ